MIEKTLYCLNWLKFCREIQKSLYIEQILNFINQLIFKKNG